MLRHFLACALLLALPALAYAGQYNPTLSIGDAAPSWTELPGVDDKPHSFADLKDKEVVVLFFTCNSCEYAQDYEDRTVALAKKYGGAKSKVAFVAVNVNLIEADRLPKMKEKAEKKAFPFDYLFDETQKIAKDYGASTTPEFFVLDKDRKIVYMGSLDDNSDAKKAKVNYLEQAIDATLSGDKITTTETVPIGCLVRYERRRNKK
ncbi:MAG TPA: thioredoxin family protein [Pirellulaceae bacterium]|nr:thioredoxin family protein [Pirellulaceae bacterium]